MGLHLGTFLHVAILENVINTNCENMVADGGRMSAVAFFQ